MGIDLSQVVMYDKYVTLHYEIIRVEIFNNFRKSVRDIRFHHQSSIEGFPTVSIYQKRHEDQFASELIAHRVIGRDFQLDCSSAAYGKVGVTWLFENLHAHITVTNDGQGRVRVNHFSLDLDERLKAKRLNTEKCNVCHGVGRQVYDKRLTCPSCDGLGYIVRGG